MCPVCLATTLWIVGGVASTGGLAAIVVTKFGGTNAQDNHQDDGPTNEEANPPQQ